MIKSTSNSKRRSFSTVLVIQLIVVILLQLAGCRPATGQPEFRPDPNVLAIEELTREMPDELAPDMVEIFKAGLDHLLDSALLKACLSGRNLDDLPRIIGDAHGLNWNSVNSTDRLKDLLLSSEMAAVYGLLDSAANRCNDSLAGDADDSNAFARNLVSEALYIDNDYLNFSNPKEELQQELNTYLACMADTDRFLRDSSCGPTASDGSGNEELPDGDADIEAAEQELPDGDADIEEDETHRVVVDPIDLRDDPTNLYQNWEDSVDWRAIERTTFIAYFALGAAILIGSPGLAAGAALTGVAFVIYEMTNPAKNPGDLCPGPYDDRLTADHPLQGANYQIGGEPLGTQELYDGCTCLGVDPNDPDPRTWGCKSEAEQRRDCVRNPYGPDDAPRPECIELLFEDNGIDPPDQCSAAMCPAPYMLVNQEQCTCGLPTPPDGLVPEPGVQDACVETQCGPDSVPMVVNGACGCVSIGGPGDGESPGSPPGPPPPDSP